MKKEILMKLILVIAIIGVIALTAIQVFAEDDPFATEDEGTNIDFTNQYEEETNQNTNSNTSGSVLQELIKNSNTEKENTLSNNDTITTHPNTGIVGEDLLVVLIVAFGAIATFAYIKIRKYKNI